MYIYKITCLINGKIYIGQCSKLPEKTKHYYGSGVIIYKAVKRYTLFCFNKEILKICNNQVELDKWEMIYIAKYKSTNPNIGYNILKGTANNFGSGSPAKLKIVKDKISKTLMGNIPWNKGLVLKDKKYSKGGSKNKHWINNGIERRQIDIGSIVPVGWEYGSMATKSTIIAASKRMSENRKNGLIISTFIKGSKHSKETMINHILKKKRNERGQYI